MCVLSIKGPIRNKSGNLFNDPRIYIYIYIYMYMYIYILARLCKRRIMKEAIHVDCKNTDGPPGRCGTSKLKVWFGLVWLLTLPGSYSCGFSPRGWPNRSPQSWRPCGRCGTRPDGQQQVSNTGGGQCGRHRWSFLGSPYNVSLMPLCHGGQWRVQHTGLSWADDGPSFWRQALRSFAVTSATCLCWWFLPDQGFQRWGRSYTSE